MSKSYIDTVAKEIRSKADPHAAALKEDMALYRLYAVLLLVKGRDVTAKDVHHAWSAWASQYEPDNENLVPFGDLTPDTQRKDQPYADAIISVASELNLKGEDDV